MAEVLIVSSSAKAAALLQDLLPPELSAGILALPSGSSARRQLAEADYDLILINAPLSDEPGEALAAEAAQCSAAGVLLLVKNELMDDVSARVEDFGVFVLGKPLNRPLFCQALKLAQSAHKRMMGLRRENERLLNRIEEIRRIDRAKCVLIQSLGMTEGQAHRYMEKQAMDLRLSRRQVAEAILKTYEP